MSFLKIYLSVLLSFSLIKLNTGTSESIRDNIKSSVRIVVGNDKQYKKVFWNQLSVEIYHPHLIDVHNGFYYAVSCMITQWTIDRMYRLIEYCPLTSRPEYQNDPWYEDSVLPKIQNDSSLILQLETYTNFFIKLLQEILNVIPYASYDSDTTILKIFLSIKTTFYFISSEKFEKLNTTFLQLILKEMAALQGFLSTNCSVLEPSVSDSQFYDFSLHIDFDQPENFNIDEFIQKLKTMGLGKELMISHHLENSQKEDMFLRSFVKIGSDDYIIKDMLKAKIQYAQTQSSTMEEILINDIGMVTTHWHYILNAAIELAINKLLIIINNNTQLSDEIVRLVKMLSDTINTVNNSPDYKNMPLPTYFLTCNEKLQEYIYNLLANFPVQEQKNNLIASVNVFNEIEFGTDVSNTTPPEDYANQLLTRLNSELKEFKLLKNSLQILEIVHEKYYAPFVKSHNSLGTLFVKTEADDEFCQVTVNLYKLCAEALYYYNECCTDNPADRSKEEIQYYLDSAAETFISIQLYAMRAIEIKVDNLDFLKMATYVASVLLNLAPEYKKQTNAAEVTHITNVIGNELNKYFLTKCSAPSYNLLLFNNIDFMNFGYSYTMKNYINKFLNFDPKNESSKQMTTLYNCLNMDYLYKNYVKTNGVFDTYENKVQIVWKGYKSSFKKILYNLLNITVHPHNLFNFYELFFMFYTQIVYYEAKRFSKKYLGDFRKYTVFENFLSTYFRNQNFPSKFKDLVNDIGSLIVSSGLKTFEYNFELDTKISRQVGELGIVLEYRNKFNSWRNYNLNNISTSFTKYLSKMIENYSKFEKSDVPFKL